MSTKRVGKLVLEDGSVWVGEAFGAEGEAEGEICFATSMCGYQEAVTDPNNAGQIVVVTYPEIGNYGVNSEDAESRKIHLSSLIVRNLSSIASNFRSEASLEEYMLRFDKVGLMGLDTRALVRRIVNRGEMRAIVSTLDEDDASLLKKVQNWPGIAGQNLAERAADSATSATIGAAGATRVVGRSTDSATSATRVVGRSTDGATSATIGATSATIGAVRDWDEPLGSWADYRLQYGEQLAEDVADDAPLVVALDFGLRWSFARFLRSMGFRVRIMPGCTTTADEVLAEKPAGVIVSNGPGDPNAVPGAVETVRQLLGKVPLMGVCFGNLLLGLASGAKTHRLKVGHRGSGMPVLNKSTGKVAITLQNHGFSLDPESLGDSLEVTHVNINDDTVTGVRHKKHPAFGVMFFPKLSDIIVGGKIIADDSHPFVAFREMIRYNTASN
ncbi:MAG: carbamoyl phosphate synthase small subunit [Planctomycetaceae bacterium]|nr:carbamoyl phosphate synthase small subunit [Planctomycetaceae bacterium]